MDLFGTDCEKVLRDLESYCDDEVAAWRRRRLERHLEACAPCLDRREFRVVLQSIVRRKCSSDELPSALADRIRSALLEE